MTAVQLRSGAALAQRATRMRPDPQRIRMDAAEVTRTLLAPQVALFKVTGAAVDPSDDPAGTLVLLPAGELAWLATDALIDADDPGYALVVRPTAALAVDIRTCWIAREPGDNRTWRLDHADAEYVYLRATGDDRAGLSLYRALPEDVATSDDQDLWRRLCPLQIVDPTAAAPEAWEAFLDGFLGASEALPAVRGADRWSFDIAAPADADVPAALPVEPDMSAQQPRAGATPDTLAKNDDATRVRHPGYMPRTSPLTPTDRTVLADASPELAQDAHIATTPVLPPHPRLHPAAHHDDIATSSPAEARRAGPTRPPRPEKSRRDDHGLEADQPEAIEAPGERVERPQPFAPRRLVVRPSPSPAIAPTDDTQSPGARPIPHAPAPASTTFATHTPRREAAPAVLTRPVEREPLRARPSAPLAAPTPTPVDDPALAHETTAAPRTVDIRVSPAPARSGVPAPRATFVSSHRQARITADPGVATAATSSPTSVDYRVGASRVELGEIVVEIGTSGGAPPRPRGSSLARAADLDSIWSHSRTGSLLAEIPLARGWKGLL